MYRFSPKSFSNLVTCDPRLQLVFKEVIKYRDCTILAGYRDQVTQNELFRQGRSQVEWPDGKHNQSPSEAIDVAPYPIDWNDIDRFHYFGGFVMGVAESCGVGLRWGGDWDMDGQVNDNRFDDLVHFELI